MRVPGTKPTIPLEELQRGLTRIIETAPSLPEDGLLPPEALKWGGDAAALIGATGYFALVPEAQVAINGLSFSDRARKREQLLMILHKARSQIELEMQSENGPTGLTATSDEDLFPPYYTKDPRPSSLDPRTSHIGLRSQSAGGNVQPPITGVQGTGGAGQISIPNSMEAKLEELAVKVALLEATLSSPKPPGVGHNRGPALENDEENEQEIRQFIERLSDGGPKIAQSPELLQVAEKEIQRAEQGIKHHVEFAKGVLKGAGFVVGKHVTERLSESAWWISVYERLKDVAQALLDIFQ